ncbi:MAG: pitrilysin family protein [Ignavibacteria bacterium]|nr:MAG: pitrilysin family protein [Ignavibacteria bacterium]
MSNYKITTLPNGTRVLSEFVPYVKSFSLGFWFNVGTRDENNLNNGISHFIEHMLFKGTKRRSAKRISEEIESYGGYLNAYTSKEHTCYYTKGLSENIARNFSVLADMIQNPLFKESHVRKEAGVIIDELNDVNDNPEELIFDKFEEVVFKGNRLSMPVIGTEGNILRFNSDKLQKFHNKRYNTSRLLIVASGSVNHDELVKLAEKNIKKGKPGTYNRREKFIPLKSNDLILEKDFHQVHTIIGRSTVGLKSKKRVKIKLLSTLLGEGSSSRLFLAVREKLGITYQISSFLNSYQDVSSFGVYYSTNQKQSAKVQQIVMKEIKKIRENKIKEKELNKIKAYLKGSTILNLESTTNSMMRLANSMLYFNRVISVEEFLKDIDSITAGDLLKTANELFAEDKLIKVILKSNENKMYKVA